MAEFGAAVGQALLEPTDQVLRAAILYHLLEILGALRGPGLVQLGMCLGKTKGPRCAWTEMLVGLWRRGLGHSKEGLVMGQRGEIEGVGGA